MSQRKKEEQRIERVLRGLLKLPENKRCINCNLLGPQYVCTTFGTFVCTTCSGVHREFNHRIKSVSMAKFNSEEITALQAGGNERARQIYFKAWDPEHNTHPDGSSINRIRDFIKHVYVERRYSGERRYDMRTVEKSSDKDNFYERQHPFEKSGLGSREDFYERRYHERSSPSGRGDRNCRDYNDDRNVRNYIDEKDYRNYTDGRSPRSIHEKYGARRSRSTARFEIVDNRIRDDRYGRRSESFRIYSSDNSMSPEPQRSSDKADPMVQETPTVREKASPPVLRPLKEIMGEDIPTLNVGDFPKANKVKNVDDAYSQKTAFFDSHDSADVKAEKHKAAKKKAICDAQDSDHVKADKNKAASATGLIDFNNNPISPDTSAKVQTDRGSPILSSTVQKTPNPPTVNSVESLLFELSVLPVGNASESCNISNEASSTAPTTSPTAPVPSPTAHVASSIKHVPSSVLPATSPNAPVASPTALKASSTTPITSFNIAATAEKLSTPKTPATPSGGASPASSSAGNTQFHPFSSAESMSRVADQNQVQTTQQHQPSVPTAGNNSTIGPQSTPTFEAFFDQPWPSSPAPTAQEAPVAPADQSSQSNSKAAQTTSSPGNGSKSSERKELPAELFTFSYSTYPAPINNWQFRPPHGMGYGMQYAPPSNVAAFPSSARSRNPFDIGDDSGLVQGAMLPSIASFPRAPLHISPHAGVQPHPSPFTSGLPPESPSYGMCMSPGGYMGQQLPNTTPSPRSPETGGFVGGSGAAYASMHPVQHFPGGYSSNPSPTASNSFSSGGGNPFA